MRGGYDQPDEEVTLKMSSDHKRELTRIRLGESARLQAVERSEFKLKGRTELIIIWERERRPSGQRWNQRPAKEETARWAKWAKLGHMGPAKFRKHQQLYCLAVLVQWGVPGFVEVPTFVPSPFSAFVSTFPSVHRSDQYLPTQPWANLANGLSWSNWKHRFQNILSNTGGATCHQLQRQRALCLLLLSYQITPLK